eukprot:365813-Chlamydomonas_euryale.AAC.19
MEGGPLCDGGRWASAVLGCEQRPHAQNTLHQSRQLWAGLFARPTPSASACMLKALARAACCRANLALGGMVPAAVEN